MSLSPEERWRTGEELQENYRRARRPAGQVQQDLGLSASELTAVLQMEASARPVTVWRVRDYLRDAVKAAGGIPQPYTVLTEHARPRAGGDRGDDA